MELERVPEQRAAELGPERVMKLEEVEQLWELEPEELGAAGVRQVMQGVERVRRWPEIGEYAGETVASGVVSLRG